MKIYTNNNNEFLVWSPYYNFIKKTSLVLLRYLEMLTKLQYFQCFSELFEIVKLADKYDFQVLHFLVGFETFVR